MFLVLVAESKLLKVNIISLNVGKNEHGFLTSPNKQLDSNLKTKLHGKMLYETDSVKYLGIQIDKKQIEMEKNRLIMWL